MIPAEGAALLLLVAVVVVAAVIAPGYLRRLRGELSRTDELAEAARALGLAFSRRDPALPSNSAMAFPFELFSRGIEQRVENVVSGTYRGRPVVAFDFWWVERLAAEAPDPQQRGARSEHSRTCAIAPFPGDTPYLRVSPEGVAAKLGHQAGIHDIELEWSDFNRAFHVVASDRKFATEFLDPPMLAWLHDHGRPWTWEVQRGFLLCHGPRSDPRELVTMLDALVGARERLPRGILDAAD